MDDFCSCWPLGEAGGWVQVFSEYPTFSLFYTTAKGKRGTKPNWFCCCGENLYTVCLPGEWVGLCGGGNTWVSSQKDGLKWAMSKARGVHPTPSPPNVCMFVCVLLTTTLALALILDSVKCYYSQ